MQRLEVKLTSIQDKEEKIREKYNSITYDSVKIEDLTFVDLTYLGAVIKRFISEDLTFIYPVDKSMLAPTNRYAESIISRLIKKKILIVDCESDIGAFYDEDFPNKFDMFKVRYRINIDIEDEKTEFFSRIMCPGLIKDENKSLAEIIWKHIAVNECVQYLEYIWNSVGIFQEIDDRAFSFCNSLIKEFSTAQVFNLIDKCSKDIVVQCSKNNLSYTDIDVIGAMRDKCFSKISYFKQKNWKIHNYSRPRQLTQSIISEHFFNKVLEIGELGFEMAPTTL